MLISVVVCTFRRAHDLQRLLDCLDEQAWSPMEVLVVDGSGDDDAVRQAVQQRCGALQPRYTLRVIDAPTGLTRQRNVGLRNAQGDLVGFLDDDVTFGAEFLAVAAGLFAEPGMKDVGGITGFDKQHYAQTVTAAWRLRRWLGIVPGLTPGQIDRLGRRAPLDFVTRDAPRLQVGWLPGFCMIFRRAALQGLSFDEELPTYAGEDKEFSIDVARRWRLLYCPELILEHHRSPTFRAATARRVFEVGFGMGRGFGRRGLRPGQCATAIRYVLGEMLMHTIAAARRPTMDRLHAVAAWPSGVVAGLRSTREGARAARAHPGLQGSLDEP